MKQKFLLLYLCLSIFTCFSQDKIQEDVKVDWWLVPLFVVDSKNEPVLDLNQEDIELWVNQIRIKKFVLNKWTFKVQKRFQKPEPSPVSVKKKIIFFMFDTAFSNKGNLKNSIAIARRIIQSAKSSSLFVLMLIDPYDGLEYIIGPENNKSLIVDAIQKKVNWSVQAKSISKILQISNAGMVNGKVGGVYTASEMNRRLQEISHSLKNTNQRYFNSFRNLHYALNTLADHKLVYLFTEGISLFARKIIPGSEGEYHYLIRQAARLLNSSGIVLFIINPAGAYESYMTPESGEDSLRYFAKESGGKYLEGNKVSISERIEKMDRAFYEIAFEDSPEFKDPLHIDIRSPRKEVKIYSLRFMERQKTYNRMNRIEKEVLVLNLIQRRPFFLKSLTLLDLMIIKQREHNKKEVYHIKVPQNWVEEKIDLYSVWIQEGSGDVKIEKSRLMPEKNQVKIEFEKRNKTKIYFTLINPVNGTVILNGITRERLKIPDSKTSPEIKAMSEKSLPNIEFGNLLEGAGDYCEKLKKSVFHYICKEKVVESFDVFRAGLISDISFYEDRASISDILRRQNKMIGSKRRLVRKNLFDYQIINDRGRIKEQRKLLSKKKKSKNKLLSVGKLGEFLSEKAVFAPLTLLGNERQSLYIFKLIKFEKIKGNRCAVIEAIPKLKEDAHYVYGQLWIDTDDYSVLKIKANPRSVKGFQRLNTIARYLLAKLFLDLEISFEQVYKGIRFPSKITLREVYKGGPYITRYRGSKGWERNHTVYLYHDYQFFDVRTEIVDD